MENEDKFWLALWGIAAVVVCTLIISICTYNVHELNTEAALVRDGNDPLRVQCLIRPFANQSMCGALAGGK